MSSKQDNNNVLYSPDGRKWTASSPEEVVNLKARGYTDTKPKGTSSSSASSKS